MAKKKGGKSAIPKWKKKKWYELVAPSIYSEKVVGETLAETPEDVIGKVVEANMMTLIGNPRKQNFGVKLRVVKVQGNKGLTKPIKLMMSHSSVRRLIRAGKDRIDLSFTTKSKDGVTLRLKPLIVTKSRTSNSTQSDVFNAAKEFLIEYVAKNNYEAVFDAVTRSTLQKEMRDSVSKVYPLKMVEMRALEVELVKGERFLGDAETVVTEEVAEEVNAEVAEDIKEEVTEEVAEAEEVAEPEVTEEVAEDAVEETEVAEEEKEKSE